MPPPPTWGETTPDGEAARVVRFLLADRVVTFPFSELKRWEHVAGEPELLAIHAHNQGSDRRIEVVAIPAMGTGFGGVPFDEAARQMAVAYRHFLEPPHRLDWDFVAQRQLAICYDGGKQVVR